MDESNPQKEINYNYKDMQDDLDLLLLEKFEQFAYKQTLKICYYLQKVRKIEVLQMRVEFLRDQNNCVWFSYAHDIHIRRIVSTDVNISFRPENILQTMKEIKEFQHKHLIRELDEFAEHEDKSSINSDDASICWGQ